MTPSRSRRNFIHQSAAVALGLPAGAAAAEEAKKHYDSLTGPSSLYDTWKVAPK